MLEYYLEQLNKSNMPSFLKKYLSVPSLLRLKKIGFFCGMDYASKDVYDFKEYISRYDHSLSVALITYKLTKDKVQTLAGLFHDISTPCFSHVVDYMNQDYEKQESTEEFTEDILRNDLVLKEYLKEDQINIDDIVNFKKYTIVDNDRPKACSDRIDGIILTGIAWTKNITYEDLYLIVNDMCVYINEYGEEELGFKTLNVAKKVLEVSDSVDKYCHSNEDTFMMDLLAKITKIAINRKYILYEDLYKYDEEEIFNLFKDKKDKEFKNLINLFETIKKKDIPTIILENIKKRDMNLLVDGKRISLK